MFGKNWATDEMGASDRSPFEANEMVVIYVYREITKVIC